MALTQVQIGMVLPEGVDTLTDAATITPDFSDNTVFSVTLGGNRTIANPTNMVVGQTGSIFIAQDATGSRTLAWGSYWDFINGAAPTVSTTASAVDRVDFIVRSATSIQTVWTGNYS
tara:strand:- start:1336 stop:1686 length:351 start_codon:yes stop_codon:yes gene_type:complete